MSTQKHVKEKNEKKGQYKNTFYNSAAKEYLENQYRKTVPLSTVQLSCGVW